MRLNLVFILLAAALCAVCAPLPNSPANRSDSLTSDDALGTHELIVGREEPARTTLFMPRQANGAANFPVPFNNGGLLIDDPILKQLRQGLERFRRDVSE